MSIKKFITEIIIITFLITSLGPAYTYAVTYQKERNFWNQRQQAAKKVLANSNRQFYSISKTLAGTSSYRVALSPQSSTEISLPNNLGKIKEFYNAPQANTNNPQIVINIQDAHCDYLAQQNIAGIIEHLGKNYNLNFVAAEGGSGKIDPGFYRSFPNKSLVKKTADYFVRKGEFAGSEYAVITADQSFLFYGVENNKLYLENLKAYRAALPIEQKWPKVLTGLKNELTVLKNSLYNVELKEYEEQRNTFNQEPEKIHDYVEYLAKVSQVYRLNLVERFPHLERLINLFNLEGKINFNRVKTERDQFVTELTKQISPEELKNLIKKSDAFCQNQIGAFSYYSYLTELARKIDGEVFLAAFPNFSSYISYSELAEKLDYNFLFEEMDTFSEEIPEKLAVNQSQTDLIKFSRQINLLEKLVLHQLNKKEWEYYQANKPEFTSQKLQKFLSGHSINISAIGELDNCLPVLESFYQAAIQRDEQLTANTLSAMAGEKVNFGVLITGGFHTQGLIKRLRDKGISYLVIAPKIGNDAKSKAIYDARLRGKHITYQEIQKDFNTTLAPPLAMPESSGVFAKTYNGQLWPGKNTRPPETINQVQDKKGQIKTGDFAGLIDSQFSRNSFWLRERIVENVKVLLHHRWFRPAIIILSVVILLIAPASFLSLGILPHYLTAPLISLKTAILTTGWLGYTVSPVVNYFGVFLSKITIGVVFTLLAGVSVISLIGNREFVQDGLIIRENILGLRNFVSQTGKKIKKISWRGPENNQEVYRALEGFELSEEKILAKIKAIARQRGIEKTPDKNFLYKIYLREKEANETKCGNIIETLYNVKLDYSAQGKFYRFLRKWYVTGLLIDLWVLFRNLSGPLDILIKPISIKYLGKAEINYLTSAEAESVLEQAVTNLLIEENTGDQKAIINFYQKQVSAKLQGTTYFSAPAALRQFWEAAIKSTYKPSWQPGNDDADNIDQGYWRAFFEGFYDRLAHLPILKKSKFFQRRFERFDQNLNAFRRAAGEALEKNPQYADFLAEMEAAILQAENDQKSAAERQKFNFQQKQIRGRNVSRILSVIFAIPIGLGKFLRKRSNLAIYGIFVLAAYTVLAAVIPGVAGLALSPYLSPWALGMAGKIPFIGHILEPIVADLIRVFSFHVLFNGLGLAILLTIFKETTAQKNISMDRDPALNKFIQPDWVSKETNLSSEQVPLLTNFTVFSVLEFIGKIDGRKELTAQDLEKVVSDFEEKIALGVIRYSGSENLLVANRLRLLRAAIGEKIKEEDKKAYLRKRFSLVSGLAAKKEKLDLKMREYYLSALRQTLRSRQYWIKVIKMTPKVAIVGLEIATVLGISEVMGEPAHALAQTFEEGIFPMANRALTAANLTFLGQNTVPVETNLWEGAEAKDILNKIKELKPEDQQLINSVRQKQAPDIPELAENLPDELKNNLSDQQYNSSMLAETIYDQRLTESLAPPYTIVNLPDGRMVYKFAAFPDSYNQYKTWPHQSTYHEGEKTTNFIFNEDRTINIFKLWATPSSYFGAPAYVPLSFDTYLDGQLVSIELVGGDQLKASNYTNYIGTEGRGKLMPIIVKINGQTAFDGTLDASGKPVIFAGVKTVEFDFALLPDDLQKSLAGRLEILGPNILQENFQDKNGGSGKNILDFQSKYRLGQSIPLPIAGSFTDAQGKLVYEDYWDTEDTRGTHYLFFKNGKYIEENYVLREVAHAQSKDNIRPLSRWEYSNWPKDESNLLSVSSLTYLKQEALPDSSIGLVKVPDQSISDYDFIWEETRQTDGFVYHNLRDSQGHSLYSWGELNGRIVQKGLYQFSESGEPIIQGQRSDGQNSRQVFDNIFLNNLRGEEVWKNGGKLFHLNQSINSTSKQVEVETSIPLLGKTEKIFSVFSNPQVKELISSRDEINGKIKTETIVEWRDNLLIEKTHSYLDNTDTEIVIDPITGHKVIGTVKLDGKVIKDLKFHQLSDGIDGEESYSRVDLTITETYSDNFGGKFYRLVRSGDKDIARTIWWDTPEGRVEYSYSLETDKTVVTLLDMHDQPKWRIEKSDEETISYTGFIYKNDGTSQEITEFFSDNKIQIVHKDVFDRPVERMVESINPQTGERTEMERALRIYCEDGVSIEYVEQTFGETQVNIWAGDVFVSSSLVASDGTIIWQRSQFDQDGNLLMENGCYIQETKFFDGRRQIDTLSRAQGAVESSRFIDADGKITLQETSVPSSWLAQANLGDRITVDEDGWLLDRETGKPLRVGLSHDGELKIDIFKPGRSLTESSSLKTVDGKPIWDKTFVDEQGDWLRDEKTGKPLSKTFFYDMYGSLSQKQVDTLRWPLGPSELVRSVAAGSEAIIFEQKNYRQDGKFHQQLNIYDRGSETKKRDTILLWADGPAVSAKVTRFFDDGPKEYKADYVYSEQYSKMAETISADNRTEEENVYQKMFGVWELTSGKKNDGTYVQISYQDGKKIAQDIDYLEKGRHLKARDKFFDQDGTTIAKRYKIIDGQESEQIGENVFDNSVQKGKLLAGWNKVEDDVYAFVIKDQPDSSRIQLNYLISKPAQIPLFFNLNLTIPESVPIPSFVPSAIVDSLDIFDRRLKLNMNGLVSVDILPHDTSFIVTRIDPKLKEVIDYRNLKDGTVEGHIFELTAFQIDQETGRVKMETKTRNWLGIANDLDGFFALTPEEVRKYNRYFEQEFNAQWHGIYFLGAVPLAAYFVWDAFSSLGRKLARKPKIKISLKDAKKIVDRMAQVNEARTTIEALDNLDIYLEIKQDKSKPKFELQNRFHLLPEEIKEKLETISRRDYQKYKVLPHSEQFTGLPCEILNLLRNTKNYAEYQEQIFAVLKKSWEEKLAAELVKLSVRTDETASREEIRRALGKLSEENFQQLAGGDYHKIEAKLKKYVEKEVVANLERAPYGDVPLSGTHIKGIAENAKKDILPIAEEIEKAAGLPLMEKKLAELKESLKKAREERYDGTKRKKGSKEEYVFQIDKFNNFDDTKSVQVIEGLGRQIQKTRHIIQQQLAKNIDDLTRRQTDENYQSKIPRYAAKKEIKYLNSYRDPLEKVMDAAIEDAQMFLAIRKDHKKLSDLNKQKNSILELKEKDKNGSSIQPVLYEKLELIDQMNSILDGEIKALEKEIAQPLNKTELAGKKRELKRRKQQKSEIGHLRDRTIAMKKDQQKMLYLNEFHKPKGRQAIVNIFSGILMDSFRDGSVIQQYYQDAINIKKYRRLVVAFQLAIVITFISITQMYPLLALAVFPTMYYSSWSASHKYGYLYTHNYPALLSLLISLIAGVMVFSSVGWIGLSGSLLITVFLHYFVSPKLRERFGLLPKPILGHQRINYYQLHQEFGSYHQRTGKKLRKKYEVPQLSDMPAEEDLDQFVQRVRGDRYYVYEIEPILADMLDDVLGETRRKEIIKPLAESIGENDNQTLRQLMEEILNKELATNIRITAEILSDEGVKEKLAALLRLDRNRADKIIDRSFLEIIVRGDQEALRKILNRELRRNLAVDDQLIIQIVEMNEVKLVKDLVQAQTRTKDEIIKKMSELDDEGKYKSDPLRVFFTFLLQNELIKGPIKQMRKNIENFNDSFQDYYGEDVMMVYDIPSATFVKEMIWREQLEFKKFEKEINDRFNTKKDAQGQIVSRLSGEEKKVAILYFHINKGKMGKKVGDQVDSDQFFQHGYANRQDTGIYSDKLKFEKVRPGVPMFDQVIGDFKAALDIEETQDGEPLETNGDVITAILEGKALRLRRILYNTVLDNKNEVYLYELEKAFGIMRHWANSHIRKLTPLIFVENPEIGSAGRGGRKGSSQLFVNLQGSRITNLMDEVLKMTMIQGGKRNYPGIGYGKWFENTKYPAKEYEKQMLNLLYLISHDLQQGVFGGPTEMAIGADNLQIFHKYLGKNEDGKKEFLIKFVMGDEVEIYRMTVDTESPPAFKFALKRYTQGYFGEERQFQQKIFQPQEKLVYADARKTKIKEAKYFDEYSRIIRSLEFKTPIAVTEFLTFNADKEHGKIKNIKVYTYSMDGFSQERVFKGEDWELFKKFREEKKIELWKGVLRSVLGNSFRVGERDLLTFKNILQRDIRWLRGDIQMIFTWMSDISLKFYRWLRFDLPMVYYDNFNRKLPFTAQQFSAVLIFVSGLMVFAGILSGNVLFFFIPAIFLFLGLVRFILQEFFILAALPLIGFLQVLSPPVFFSGSILISGTAVYLAILSGNYWLLLIPAANLILGWVWQSVHVYNYARMYPPFLQHHLRGLFRRFLTDRLFRDFLGVTFFPALIFGIVANIIYTPEYTLVPFLMGLLMTFTLWGIIGPDKFSAPRQFRLQQLKEWGKDVTLRKNPRLHLKMMWDINLYMHRIVTANTMNFMKKIDIGSELPKKAVNRHVENASFSWGQSANEMLANIERLGAMTWRLTLDFFGGQLNLGGAIITLIGLSWWLGITAPSLFWLILIPLASFVLGSPYFSWWTGRDLNLADEWKFFKPLWTVTTFVFWLAALFSLMGITVPFLPVYWVYFVWLILVAGLALEYPYYWLFNRTSGKTENNWEKLQKPSGRNLFWTAIKNNLQQIPLAKIILSGELIFLLLSISAIINPVFAAGLAAIHLGSGNKFFHKKMSDRSQQTLQTIGYIGGVTFIIALLQDWPLMVIGAVLIFIGSLSVYAFGESELPIRRKSFDRGDGLRAKRKSWQQVGSAL